MTKHPCSTEACKTQSCQCTEGCVSSKPVRPIVYWAVGEYERLTHETETAALEDWLEQFALPGGKWADNMPGTVEVIGYARMVPTLRDYDSLNHLLEHLDGEFGDPEGGWTDPTEAMLAAERVFHSIVLAEYEPWMCEPVYHKTINVRDWIDAQERSKVAVLEAKLSEVYEWTYQFGKALCPPGADTYGEGMRDAKEQVANIILRKYENMTGK
jgi:hypothetical protein